MSICGGIAGRRGKNPVGIFIHNDAGGSSLNAAYWANSLANGSHNKEKGFAHAYCGSDGVRQVEDDANCAWHCGNTDGNINYLSIEVCQSMGDLNTFKQNEERALQWCAQKCKQYGIIPNENTIRLHQEVFPTACPHRSVELHGGNQSAAITDIEQEGENEEMRCLFTVEGKGAVFYFDGYKIITLGHPDELKIVQQIYKDNNGKDMPCYKWSPSVPWYARLMAVINRKETTSI